MLNLHKIRESFLPKPGTYGNGMELFDTFKSEN
jgi:hypothetical protein